MSRRANCILLGTIIVAGAALRFYGISSKSLWLDEALSWRMQQFSVGEIVERCGDAAGTHPPLYFVVLHFWTRAFGDTEAAMRSLAGLLGTALILAVYVLCRALMLFPRRDSRIVCRQRASLAGLLAAALVALSPLHIHLSQQVRGYTLAVLMVLLAAISLLRALSAMPGSAADERGLFNRLRAARAAWWGAFVACAACASYTNHLAVVSVTAQGIFAAAYIASRDRQARGGKRSTQLFGLIAAGAVLAVAYLPWMPRLLAQSESLRHSWQKRTTAAQCAESVFAALVSTPVERLEPQGATSWASAACVAALMVAAGRSKSWGAKYLAWSGALPAVFLLGYSMTSSRGVVESRYLVFAQSHWLLAAAVATMSCRGALLRAAVGATLAALSLGACAESWREIGRSSSPDMRAAAEYLLARQRPNEITVAQGSNVFFELSYYVRHGRRPFLAVARRDRSHMFGSAHLSNDDLITVEELTARRPDDVWAVGSETFAAVSSKNIASFPADRWTVLNRRGFPSDYNWETPISVAHLRRITEGASQ